MIFSLFEKAAEERSKEIRSESWFKEGEYYSEGYCEGYEKGFHQGAEFGYNKANKWFDARTSIPLPKKAEIYRYTLEAISDKGDIVCYDYKDKNWKKLVIEDEKVTYIPVEIKMWCNKPIISCKELEIE